MSSLKEKPPTQDKPGISTKEQAALWAEARLVYPLYFFLATHFKLETPLTSQAELPVACPTADVFNCVMRWLDSIDTKIRANQLRQLLHSVKDIQPENLRAVILRLLHRPVKTSTDRDNIDLLLATYFALCAPEDLYACEATLADVAHVLSGVLPDADGTPLEWCASLDQILETTKPCRGLRDLFAGKLLEKGRELKDSAGFMFYDPAALVAFTRFNFLLRRAFFRLLHADLRAIREGLSELERRGISTVDCRGAGLTAQEPVGHLREISLSWRQPIRSDYAAESANQTFEQLLSIRAAVERALGITSAENHIPATDVKLAGKTAKPAPAPPREDSTRSAEERAITTHSPERAPAPARENQASAIPKTAKPAPTVPAIKQAPPAGAQSRAAAQAGAAEARKISVPVKPKAADSGAQKGAHESHPAENSDALSVEFEQCLENIWEQLIEAPPARGRSMGTVNLEGARILLSAWEVNAFISDGGQLSADLRRAVTARAMVVVTREEQKRSGDTTKLAAAISQGRREMTYLQERVEEAQRAKNTEAAVNLGITARRLLSAMEEAQAG
ncbi:MAG TPA: hypothetical protein VGR72_04625 [Candidatus Acidoferrales bacterium]|nr:hypothetical protein [Candidatus Acidoferrales bacterium]